MSPKKKIPTKSELVQLQKLYKTDEKIGERLGGVPAYLVAYWRRKKNVPKHSQPKFSEKEIRNLWERFGDDDKCGLELGISKAAFYNWRRRYGIKEKPAFLKLEQLEFNFPGMKISSSVSSLYGKQTIAQKILARASENEKVEAGETVAVEPDMTVVDIVSNDLFRMFSESGSELVWNPNKICISLSTCAGEVQPESSDSYRNIKEFAKRQGIKLVYDTIEGNCQQASLEQGHILPGQLVAGCCRYVVSLGAVNAAAFKVDKEDMVNIWASGKTEINVPKTIRVDVAGRRSRGVYGKDIALSILKQMQGVHIEGKAIEYYGNIISQMNVSERFTLNNLTVDLGAQTAICPFDSTTRRYLTGRTLNTYNPLIADKNAEYDEIYQINIDQLTPQLKSPNQPESIKPVIESEGIPVSTVIIGTDVNGRFDDLRVASEILKGKKVNPECRLYVYPSSKTVYLEALKKGLIRVLVEAGAVIVYPGYWPECHTLIFTEGERALITGNDHLIVGMDSEKIESYLVSPATAAASALNGQITDPARFVK